MCAAGRICVAAVALVCLWLSNSPGERRTGIRPANSPDHFTQAQEAERNRFIVVMIRLARFGARKQPYYRIVVIEKDRARNGRSIEVVGTYNPRTNPASVDLKHERIAYWRSKGATLSPILAKLVAKHPETAAAEPAVEAATVAPPTGLVTDPAAA
jgi:small subunit ribosomal protein S16